jgi:hypothetical protein
MWTLFGVMKKNLVPSWNILYMMTILAVRSYTLPKSLPLCCLIIGSMAACEVTVTLVLEVMRPELPEILSGQLPAGHMCGFLEFRVYMG